ncbi:hypothetical protein X801_07358, partial [Opisthorchis viverrini]
MTSEVFSTRINIISRKSNDEEGPPPLAQSDQLNCASGNARIKEEIMHVRQLIGENQKALSSIVKAVSQMQDQVYLGDSK